MTCYWLNFTLLLSIHFYNRVVDIVATDIGAGGLGFDSWANEIGKLLPAACHRCNVSSICVAFEFLILFQQLGKTGVQAQPTFSCVF